MSERVHRGRGHDRAGERLVGPADAHPVQLGEVGERHPRDERRDLRRPVRVSMRRARGPAELGAAPASRASVRNVLLVRDDAVGRPRSTSSSGPARPAPRRRARAAPRSAAFGGGSPPNQSRVRRPAPSGTENAPLPGPRRAPAASSSEPPPMSRLIRLPALQPNQRRTARNVSRASSSPVRTLQLDAGLAGDPLEHRGAVARVADGRGGEGQQLVAAELVGLPAGADHRALTRASAPPGSGRRRRRCARPGAARTCATAAGVGWAPRCASTTSRCTVLDPTSSTPSRTGPVSVVARRHRDGSASASRPGVS